MSLFAELKRRNVVRMAMLYVVASWLLLQVGDVLFDALELPAAWDRLVLALVILGFPLALIFAWVYEMTPEGLKRESQIDRSQSITRETGRKLNVVIAVLLVIAIVVVGLDRFIPEAPSVVNRTSQTGPDTAVSAKSIAVLPFANRSAREDDAYFVDGIHDDILTQLAKIGSLTVTSRTSVEQFRDPSQHGGIREIAGILGVRNILEGGVQRSGDRIRINVQLIDVTDDDHLWAETFNRELTATNLFAVQGEIAAAVADALRVVMAADEKQALSETPTESLAAYDLYLLGRFHWNQRTEESIQLAKGYFEQAIDEDPKYVRALSGLADSYMMLVGYGNLEGAEAYPVAEEAINRAMAIDDSVSDVWASLGYLRRTRGDQEGAEEALLRAIELDERNYAAWLWYGVTLESMRRYDEALLAMEKAYALEPMSKPVNRSLAGQYLEKGDFVRARQHFERLAALEKERSIWFRNRAAETYFFGGNFSRAITMHRRILDDNPGDQFALESIALSYLGLGDVDEARRWFARAEDMNRMNQSMYWAFEADEDYDGAVVYLEDKLKLAQERRNLGTLHWLFRASYLGGNIPQAGKYLAEMLQILNGRFEVNPADRSPDHNLLRATFLIRHGEQIGLDPQRGREMVDEILAGLELLRKQGVERPSTLASLAVAHALKGDSLAALTSLDEAIDRGFRNHEFVLSQPAFDGLRDSKDFAAITARIETLLAEDRAMLASVEFEPYTPPDARQPVAMSRSQFQKYEGYYSNGNVLVRFFVAEDGSYMAQLGQEAPIATLPFAEDMFFFPLSPDLTVTFVSDDSGEVSHFLANSAGRSDRMKRVPAPPPAIEVERAVLERYEGTYAYDRLSGRTENRSEVDLWVAVISVDEQGKVWIDFDNQPILEIVPISETKFHIRGFDTTLEMIVSSDTGSVDRIDFVADGRLLVFEPQ